MGDPRRFRSSSRQALVLESLFHTAQTAQEVAISVVGLSAPISALEGTRRRVSSLKRIGLVEETGEERTNPGSPTPSAVYGLTSTGLVALNNLRVTGWSL